MSPGPLRRSAGALGLMALAPTAVMLVMGSVSLADAALRAGVTLVVVVTVGRVVGWWLSATARRFERRHAERGPDDPDRDPATDRRATATDGMSEQRLNPAADGRQVPTAAAPRTPGARDE